MDLPPEVVDDVVKRLRRAAGQVQGVERMVLEGRDCRDIVTQLSASIRALEQAGFRLVTAGVAYCMDDPQRAEADGYPLAEIERLFMKLT
ncbi:MAG: metal-sensitive transcriptional regulator [Acidimicrobiales bacterium]|jgi:DNA-binding FrmR family transcriptional regulator|nr:metal-sensitive transcriptional regulator [Acidimicrobiales bacterium]